LPAAPTENRVPEAQDGFLRCRPFWLFNVAQVDGMPEQRVGASAVDVMSSPTDGHGPMERALRLVGGRDAVIRHGVARAVYVPEFDEIRLPLPKRCANCEDYCATLLCELVHRTGRPKDWWPSWERFCCWGIADSLALPSRGIQTVLRLGRRYCAMTAARSSRRRDSQVKPSTSLWRGRCQR
jgi:hypothetical protein